MEVELLCTFIVHLFVYRELLKGGPFALEFISITLTILLSLHSAVENNNSELEPNRMS